MFVCINIYFRPYEFLAVYQRFARNLFIFCSNCIYIRVLKQQQK